MADPALGTGTAFLQATSHNSSHAYQGWAPHTAIKLEVALLMLGLCRVLLAGAFPWVLEGAGMVPGWRPCLCRRSVQMQPSSSEGSPGGLWPSPGPGLPPGLRGRGRGRAVTVVTTPMTTVKMSYWKRRLALVVQVLVCPQGQGHYQGNGGSSNGRGGENSRTGLGTARGRKQQYPKVLIFLEEARAMGAETLCEVGREWKCPVCQPQKQGQKVRKGSVDWYALQALMQHAGTVREKGSRTTRHRMFFEE